MPLNNLLIDINHFFFKRDEAHVSTLQYSNLKYFVYFSKVKHIA